MQEQQEKQGQKKGKSNKKSKNNKKGKTGGPESLAVDCFSGFMDHGTTQSFFLFFSDADTGAWVNPAPGSVDVQLANGQKTFPAVPGDVFPGAINSIPSRVQIEQLQLETSIGARLTSTVTAPQ